MKLSQYLKKIILENTDKKIILEISQKLKDDLVTKFLSQTTDKKDTKITIMGLINSFEKYQQGLPIEKRDITKYTLIDLKKLIESKSYRKNTESAFKLIKSNSENVNDTILKRNIKKFYEIKSILPEKNAEISDYNYLTLDKFIEDNYEGYLYKKYTPIFKSEEPNTSEATFRGYLEEYVDKYNDIPLTQTPINFLTFSDLEHMLDALAAKKDVGTENKATDYSDVELLYDEDNQVIIKPKTKAQCMKYKRGRAWCITWEGSSNRYYHYRLNEGKTIYYVIDEDMPYDNLNHIMVVLVDKKGNFYLADKSNSRPYDGMQQLDWEKIVAKQPKLSGLEYIFQPEKLTDAEENLLVTLRSKKIGDNPVEEIPDPEMLEIWVELLQDKLSDIQYRNIPVGLKKKYIASGFKLNSDNLENSEPPVLAYYAKKQKEALLNKNLSSISDADISLLNMPIMKSIKAELKPRLMSDVKFSGTKVSIEYPNNNISKLIALYGFQDIIDSIPVDITYFKFKNNGEANVKLNLENIIGKLKQLETLTLENCIDKLPNEIMELTNLEHLNLRNNKSLVQLPPIENLPNLNFISLKNTGVLNNLSASFRKIFDAEQSGDFLRTD